MAKKRRRKNPATKATRGRKSAARKTRKKRPPVKATRRRAGKAFGGAMLARLEERSAQIHWPYAWVDDSAVGQWCYDSRDAEKRKLAEWKFRPGEHPFPYKCRVGAGDEWGEASSGDARDAIVKKIGQRDRHIM